MFSCLCTCSSQSFSETFQNVRVKVISLRTVLLIPKITNMPYYKYSYCICYCEFTVNIFRSLVLTTTTLPIKVIFFLKYLHFETPKICHCWCVIYTFYFILILSLITSYFFIFHVGMFEHFFCWFLTYLHVWENFLKFIHIFVKLFLQTLKETFH